MVVVLIIAMQSFKLPSRCRSILNPTIWLYLKMLLLLTLSSLVHLLIIWIVTSIIILRNIMLILWRCSIIRSPHNCTWSTTLLHNPRFIINSSLLSSNNSRIALILIIIRIVNKLAWIISSCCLLLIVVVWFNWWSSCS